MSSKSSSHNNCETTEEITISLDEYTKLQATIKQQQTEIGVLEYRIKTLLSE